MTEEEAQRRANGGEMTKNPFKTHLPFGMSNGWWEIRDWARQYLYIADTDNEHTMSYYQNLTDDQLIAFIEASSNPFIMQLQDTNSYMDPNRVNLPAFWPGAYVSREEILAVFSDEVSRSRMENYPYVWLFDTKLDENGNEQI